MTHAGVQLCSLVTDLELVTAMQNGWEKLYQYTNDGRYWSLGTLTATCAYWLLAIFQVWLAHAVGYLVHEYAHSLIAWVCHTKANPLALDYGGLNPENLLFLNDIDET